MLKKLNFLILLTILLFKTSVSFCSFQEQTLVTLHGFMGYPWNLYYITAPYDAQQMNVINWAYPSREKKIEEHAVDLVKELQKISYNNPGRPINFITHSMGGLVLRAAINHADCPEEAKIGSAALLAPPNQGACWGRFLSQFEISHQIGLDASGKELMTELDFEHLGQFPETMSVLVIAGNLSYNPFIPGENDGTVAVDETFLTTPHQHVVIHAGHKSILLSQQAAQIIYRFFNP
jgi:hypothetical protein